ncbi:MAG: hypothetical protein ACRDQ5_07780, partial [Sciscionella sp.]
PVRTLEGDIRGVRALAVDPAGAWVAAAGDGGAVRLWDPITGVPLRTLEGHPGGGVGGGPGRCVGGRRG